MPKLNSTVKAVRIDNDKLAELEQRLNGKTINSWLNEQITEFIEGKPVKISEKSEASPNNDLKEVESMANFFGLTLDKMLSKICEGLTDGTLTIENGKVVGVPEIDLENLKEACHDRGIGMQEAIDKTVKNLRSGK